MWLEWYSIVWKDNVKKLKKIIVFVNASPLGFSIEKFDQNPLSWRAKLKTRMMMARLTKWEVELELRDLLAVKILSVKSCTMYLLSLIPGL